MCLSVAMAVSMVALAATSCVKPEKANTEADILKVEVTGVKLIREAVITNDAITMVAAPGEDVTQVAPTFTLSKGATITPASGMKQNFTKPVVYTVTAEDKMTQKKYTVSITVMEEAKKDKQVTYSFEDVRMQGDQFQVFLIKGANGAKDEEWASSNLGYAMTQQAKTPADYPACQDPNGYKGNCLKLTTKDVGSFGAMFKAYLATGTLFLGKLDTDLLLAKPLESTKFGIPVTAIPTKMTGYYKYKSGEKYQEADKKVPGKKDACVMYAVLYEVTPEAPYLNGTNSLTGEQIVLMARTEDPAETDEWTTFELPFKEVNGKKVDPQKLAEGKYNFSIILSSSKDGAKHFGAVGSTLMVDELSVFFKADK